MTIHLWVKWALSCQKNQLLKAGIVHSYASNIQK